MHLRLTLQGRILVLIVSAMALILFLSAYLHQLITRSLVEDNRYDTAIGRTVAMAARIGSSSGKVRVTSARSRSNCR